MTVETKVTYCRICEPLCGLVATVEDGTVTQLRPDADHPLSRGQACPKGIAFVEIQNDPDRVLHPLKRNDRGEFERVTWDSALDDIVARLRALPRNSIGGYLGNPPAFSYSHATWFAAFLNALGTKHSYSAGSQDINSRFAASALLYGAVTQLPFPDLPRTDFLMILGGNPLVSHGSALNAPRIKDQLSGITKRGGRVVVVDPRRTETARAFEHVQVRPDADAWLLLSMLQVIFAEGLADEAAIKEQTVGVDALRRAAAQHPPEETEAMTGVPADVVRQLARDFATAPSATAYGRTGSCLGRHATLVGVLIDVLAIVTGNLDRAGGTLFSRGVIPLEEVAEKVGLASYAVKKSRLGGFDDVLGSFPAVLMADEITTPGDGQLRALFVSGGNPILSVPNGQKLAQALPQLDLMVSLDLYVNDTNRYADYILPATTWLEREDFPIAVASAAPTPFIQTTEAVVAPRGEARQEWAVYDEIATRIGVEPLGVGMLQKLAPLSTRMPVRATPKLLFSLLLRVGPYGDRLGLRRGGLNAKKLRQHPHGIVLADHAATGQLKHAVRHKGGKVRLDAPALVEELERLGDRHSDDPVFPLRLIGLRELRSHNSWMHNSPTLMKGANRKHQARINPLDAEAAGVVDGGAVRIRSRFGEIETLALVSDEVGPGTVAVPHGWGHEGGGWELANKSGGANSNRLASSEIADVERLAGMAHLNGIAVALEVV
ncbi:molybdopterin-dependent oxidoreductase [Nocardioides humilatus]|uniref:Molybdopterin-dependent oxidoreductase n=1 Tax=Nocardioides humilatus TaxID=2607660 RepID=A0A5B1LEG4_9ACTN|nr:molybdopterin-dependent oxidoreductase [Nocardioides humilatus]KAA1417997.1 molybdopterin-dependent oxidoreductase [Nocardioides humilatus]